MSRFSVPKMDTATRSTEVLLPGELVFDETQNALYVGDGITPGGVLLSGNSDQSNTSIDTSYTAFEVYATDVDIPADSLDQLTGLNYTEAVPAGMTHAFTLYTNTDLDTVEDSDVVIDWGDNTVESLSRAVSAVPVSELSRESVYELRHTYMTPGRHVVTIYGSDYWGISCTEDGNNNLICRCFDTDLPLANCLVSLAGFASGSLKLLTVRVPAGLDMFRNVVNAARLFAGCKNLLAARGINSKFDEAKTLSKLFYGCTNMYATDFVLPSAVTRQGGYDSVFESCTNLSIAVKDLLPLYGFSSSKTALTRTFYGCPGLYGTVPSDILWEDDARTWLLVSECFYGCSDDIRSQVPKSWGGLASEPISAKNNPDWITAE